MRMAEDSVAKEFKNIYKSTVAYKIHANKQNVVPKPRFIIVEGTLVNVNRYFIYLILNNFYKIFNRF